MSAPRNTATATPATGQEEACARAWVALSAAHARISGELARALASACDLSINDFEILVRVQHAGRQGLRLGSLNGVVQLTQPSLSRAVARLEERGWLARAEAAGDRRGVLVTLTSQGQDVLRRAIPVHARTIREFLLDPLEEAELDLLAVALDRIAGR